MDAEPTPSSSTRQRVWAAVIPGALVLAFDVFVVVSGREIELNDVAAAAIGMVLVLTLTPIGAWLLASARRKRHSPSHGQLLRHATSCFALAGFGLGCAMLLPLHLLWADPGVVRTLPWCDEVVGRIQTFEAVHERWPRALDELGELQRPWWAQELDYRVQPDGFSLRFGPRPGSVGPDLRSGFDSRSCSWTLRGESGRLETPVASVPWSETWGRARER